MTVDRRAVAATLARLFTETTGLRADDLDPEASFLELGLSSVALVDTFRAVRETLGVRPSIRLVFEEHRTLEKLTAYIAELMEAAPVRGAPMASPSREALLGDGADELAIPPSIQHLWFLARYSDEASRALQHAVGLRVTGPLDRERLEAAWTTVVARHGALRVRALADRDALFVAPPPERAEVSWRRAPGDALPAAVRAAATEALELTVAAARLVVVEAAPDEVVLVLVVHALVADRVSAEQVVDELCRALRGERVLPPALAFSEVLARLAERPPAIAPLVARLTPRPPALELPGDRPRPAVKAYGGARLVRGVPAPIVAGVAAVARQVGAPTSVVVLAALAHLAGRLSGARPVVIGVSGRVDDVVPRDAVAVGPLSSPLPVLIETELGGAVRALLSATGLALADALDHAGVPFAALADAVEPVRDQSRSALFTVAFDAQQERAPTVIPGLGVERVQLPTATCRTDLEVAWVDGAAGVELVLDYSTELFERATAAAWAKALIATLEALPSQLDGRTAELSWSTAREPAPPTPEAPMPALPVEAFLAAARAHPERTAVLGAAHAIDYGALERGSAALAAQLIARGVRPQDRVGLSLARGPRLVEAVLGVLRAGAAYVPLDPAYPAARLAWVAEDAGLAALIADHDAAWAPAWLPRLALAEAEAAGAAVDALPSLRPEHAAYVLYTSGSTGRPKGVVVEHGQLAHLLAWARGCFSAEELAYTLASTSLSFDLSAFELLAPLSAGATVVVARDALELAEHPARDRVTLVNTVPSAAAELVRLGAWPASVRVVALAGEPLRGALARAVRAEVPHARLFNLYGPTECTVYATAAEVPPGEGEPNIGHPIPGLFARVLDDEGAPVPVGGRGELYLAGATVARGYLGRPELTAERFVPDPAAPARRAYRTGDRVRRRPDGALDFLGRLDHQVKLRGFRIELGEIEAALTGPIGASEALVVSEGEGAEQRLVAFVAGVGARGPADLRAALAALLPDPLVPRHLAVLDVLPRLPNGKVDRARLPAASGPAAAEPSRRRPTTSTERALAEVWSLVLGVPEVSLDDDFFALGGHSLMMTALLVAIRERFGVRPKLRAMFDEPTLAGLARHVEALVGAARAAGGAPRDLLPRAAEDPAHVAARFARLDEDAVLPDGLAWGPLGVDPAAPARAVLLTGATGFVGVHVLAELLRRSAARVVCVVRGADPEARLRAALEAFALSDGVDLSRVEALTGDVAAPSLGLAPDTYQRLAHECDRVVHGAAEVNFVYPYDVLRRTNVGGTLEVLRLAAHGRTKPLFFLSTVAVWPMGAELSFAEDDDLAHGHRLNLGYDESKWVAERMLARARARGFPLFVLRPGEVSGHSVTGRGVGEHFAMALVKGSLQIGAVPPFHGLVDLSPVDYVAAATAALVSGPLPARPHHHLTNPWPMDAREMLSILRAVGYRFEEPEFEAWKRRLFEHPRFADNALYPYAPILEDFDPLNLQFPRYDASAARAAVEPCGVRCHPLDEALVRNYVRYYQGTGFLPLPVHVGRVRVGP